MILLSCVVVVVAVVSEQGNFPVCACCFGGVGEGWRGLAGPKMDFLAVPTSTHLPASLPLSRTHRQNMEQTRSAAGHRRL